LNNLELQEERKRKLQTMTKDRYLLEAGPGLLPPQTHPAPPIKDPKLLEPVKDDEEAYPDTARVDRATTSSLPDSTNEPTPGTMGNKQYDSDSVKLPARDEDDVFGIKRRVNSARFNTVGKTSPLQTVPNYDDTRLPYLGDATERVTTPFIAKRILQGGKYFGYVERTRMIVSLVGGRWRDYLNAAYDSNEVTVINRDQLAEMLPQIGSLFASIDRLKTALSLNQEALDDDRLITESRKRHKMMKVREHRGSPYSPFGE
jgi:hypothetical protein